MKDTKQDFSLKTGIMSLMGIGGCAEAQNVAYLI